MSILNGGADDDWQEGFRATVYPKLHPLLARFGGYAIGTCGPEQYVCSLPTPEEELEQELVEWGFVRNPIACYKRHEDGRESEGSWVLLPENDPTGRLESGKQLHITLFKRPDGRGGRDIYAHNEYDWRDAPLKHLREVEFSPERGIEQMQHLLNEETYYNV